MGVQRLYGTRQKKLDSLDVSFFGVLNSSGVGFSITPSAANLKTRYSDIYSTHATSQCVDPLADNEFAKIAGSDKKPSLNAHYQVLQHRGRWAEVKKKIETS